MGKQQRLCPPVEDQNDSSVGEDRKDALAGAEQYLSAGAEGSACLLGSGGAVCRKEQGDVRVGGAEGSECRDVRLTRTEGAERCVFGRGCGVSGKGGAGRLRDAGLPCAACIVEGSDLSVKQRRATLFPSGTRRYVCKSADSVVSVREERDDARVIGRRVGPVSGGAERWQHHTRGNQCVRRWRGA